MTFERALRADVVAAVAALVLLFVMALDWYSSTVGEEARRIEKLSEPEGAAAGTPLREQQEDARIAAEGEERNAWQADGVIDRVILVGLLLSVLLAQVAIFARAARRRFDPPYTPSTLAALVATVTALLVAYRTIQEPGFDERSTVEAGAPLALVALGVIALACISAMRAEEDGTAWREPEDRIGPAAGGS